MHNRTQGRQHVRLDNKGHFILYLLCSMFSRSGSRSRIGCRTSDMAVSSWSRRPGLCRSSPQTASQNENSSTAPVRSRRRYSIIPSLKRGVTISSSFVLRKWTKLCLLGLIYLFLTSLSFFNVLSSAPNLLNTVLFFTGTRKNCCLTSSDPVVALLLIL